MSEGREHEGARTEEGPAEDAEDGRDSFLVAQVPDDGDDEDEAPAEVVELQVNWSSVLVFLFCDRMRQTTYEDERRGFEKRLRMRARQLDVEQTH